MHLRQTLLSREDIRSIYLKGLKSFGRQKAETYLEGLIDVFDLLAANPMMARERTEFSARVRIHPYRAHLVVYRIEDSDLIILRVLASRQDIETQL